MAPPPTSRPAWAALDFDALRANLNFLRTAADGASVVAVVKADAYGHGAVPVAQYLRDQGVDWFAVSLVEEGESLRAAGVDGRILLLTPVAEDQMDAALRAGLTPQVASLDALDSWARVARQRGERPAVHIEVDTGMHRLGLPPADLEAAIGRLRDGPLELEGVASHLAHVGAAGLAATAAQVARFEAAAGRVAAALDRRPQRHLANSAALLDASVPAYELARPGLALYGVDGRTPASAPLRPVLTVACRVAEVYPVAAGEEVGYGGTWRAPAPGYLAVLPLGYADGFPWTADARAGVLLEGRRRPLAGRVNMDSLVVDLGPAACPRGSEAVILGRQGDARIGAGDIAAWAATTPYEILTRFAARLPRIRLGEAAGSRSGTGMPAGVQHGGEARS